MKGLAVCVLLLLPLASFSQPPYLEQTKREVNGVKVDLQPIYDWKKKPRGKRPMPDWKDAWLLSINRPIPGGYECKVLIRGEPHTIIVMNLPDEVATLQARQGEITKRLDKLGKENQKLNEQSKWLFDHYPDSFPDTPEQARESRKLEQAYQRYEVVAKKQSAEYDSLHSEFDRNRAKIDKLKYLLILNTGRKISGLEVWEHGRTVKESEPKN